MDLGELNAGLNALDVAFVDRDNNGNFVGLREGSERLPVVTAETNPITGGIELTGAKTHVVYGDGNSVHVAGFRLGDFEFAGGSIVPAADGTWYIGVDLFSNALIALPRLGHTGWIPVAKVVVSSGEIGSISHIPPKMPPCRIPNTVRKIMAGETINVYVMGSSLTEGTGSTVWAGMLFGSGQIDKMRIPATISLTNIGLGGAPNQYQLAQLGFCTPHTAGDYPESGWPRVIDGMAPPLGRSPNIAGADLVVIGLLANGGDYRMECVEPIIRRLRELGVEVIVTTDNPHGAAQVGGTGPYLFQTQAAAISAGLYVDGPSVIKVADKYGIEVADTAAYVVDAVLRYPELQIYRDSIHMFGAEAVARYGQPGGGYEVWARAIRSCLPVDAETVSNTRVASYDFASDIQGWGNYNPTYGDVTYENGSVKTVKKTASTGQWGCKSPAGTEIISPILNGNTVRIQGTLTHIGDWTGRSVVVGLQGGGSGWSSASVAVNAGAFDVTVTATRDIATDGFLLFFGNWDAAPLGMGFYVNDVTITVNHSGVGTVYETSREGRDFVPQNMPACRVVTDLKTPGDAAIILPHQEYNIAVGSGTKGTLQAHPLGAASFARRFSPVVGSTSDMLVVTSGQRASIAANGVVGFSLIYYSVAGDPQVVFDVYSGNNFQKTITIGAQTLTREIYLPIYTPTQLSNSSANPSNNTISVRVTSGTLRVCALVALTADLTFYPPEDVTFIGTWTGRVTGGSPNIPGYGTDASGSYAKFRCPNNGRRVSWLCSSKPNSKNVDTYSGRSITSNQSTVGANHAKMLGNHIGPGEVHYIKLVQDQSSADQSTNGYGLHIGGVIVVNDR